MSGGRRFVGKASICLFAGAVMTAGMALQAAGAPSALEPAIRAAARDTASRPHVYLMRGLLNIFSLGMDQLAAQIARRRIDAGVYNHTLAEPVVGEIVRKYRAGDHGPYILVGHSLGADAVMWMAQQLNAQGVPVALVVPFDGTGSFAASRNVGCVLNLTQRKYAYMRPGAGFRGMLMNVDVSGDASIDHFTIDKSPRLQAEALKYVLQTAHGEACRPGGAPIMARPQETPKPAPAAKLFAPKQAAPQTATPARATAPVLRPGIAAEPATADIRS